MTEPFNPTRGGLIQRLVQQDTLNFWLSNHVPRRLLTVWMGRLSRIENPWLARLLIAGWRLFAPDLDLTEARETRFRSLHECFIRELKPGSRPIHPSPASITSPCDAMVMAAGSIHDSALIQAKGLDYRLEELLLDPQLAARYRDGRYLTLRLKSTMYHRFHAPTRCRVHGVHYLAGDVWNVNPPTVRRLPKLYCRNERAVIDLDTLDFGPAITLVPVAAILVASIRLHFLDVLLHLRYSGPNHIPCEAQLEKGEEMGYFQHGSTIILLATSRFRLAGGLAPGSLVKVGEPLLWDGDASAADRSDTGSPSEQAPQSSPMLGA